MRIGVAPSGRRSAADAVTLARLAEDAGLDEVWVSEDYLERGAFAVAGAMAAVTSRVRVGLGVVNPWTRHVALTAMEAHALDEVADGRSVLGIGASNKGWMQDRLGIPFERPIAHLADYTRGLRTLLAGERLVGRIGGQDVDAALDAHPPRNVPIVWGVKGPRALELSATEADGVMLSVLSSPDYVRWVRESYQPRDIVAYASFAVDADRSVARERLRAHTARFLGMHGASAITERAGLSAEFATACRERLLAGTSAADLVDDDVVGAVTVSGTVDDAAAALLAHRDAGLDSLVVIDDGSADPAELVAGIVAVASHAGLG
ncbi:LLM class flavin-dependent oxidoreductase [Homoserinibacter sp. GY 40078]|uniref:LLM class flavin-dependent oxidoreductase n=1 Tax=Homoserinibacter sp. GY 40078 TaxID=2603275 RepID=UPI0011C83C11|nr:LLM class flavin-dependent oxidoreductase [Homoserinibacter sp. GY 40078]TXK16965.1 LLM class flavin-dependent oxidoreductase [Homoserinibacter sp. GY 40078]